MLRKVAEGYIRLREKLALGEGIAVPKQDLFGPDADTLGLYNKKPGLELFGSDMLKEIYRPLQDLFSGHTFDVNDNEPLRFPDVKADDISEILVKGQKDQRILQAIAEDLVIACPVQFFFPGGLDLTCRISQGLYDFGIDALVDEDFYHDLMRKDLYRLFTQLHGEFYGGDDVFFGNPGVFFGNFINGITCAEHVKDVGNGNAGTLYAGFAKTHVRVDQYLIFKMFNGHVYGLLTKAVYHSLDNLSSKAYASLARPLPEHRAGSNSIVKAESKTELVLGDIEI